jgi:hypothetical protein
MSKEFLIGADEDGSLVFIYTDELAFLLEEGESEVTRASHVEPTPGGGWTADMSPVGRPVLGPFPLRQDALDAEVTALEEVLFS